MTSNEQTNDRRPTPFYPGFLQLDYKCQMSLSSISNFMFNLSLYADTRMTASRRLFGLFDFLTDFCCREWVHYACLFYVPYICIVIVTQCLRIVYKDCDNAGGA